MGVELWKTPLHAFRFESGCGGGGTVQLAKAVDTKIKLNLHSEALTLLHNGIDLNDGSFRPRYQRKKSALIRIFIMDTIRNDRDDST